MNLLQKKNCKFLKRKIMDYLSIVKETMRKMNRPVSAGEVEKESGLERKMVDKAFKELKENGEIVSPIRCKWELIK